MKKYISIFCLFVSIVRADQYHVDTSGVYGAVGSIADPWRMQYALDSAQNHGGALVAGDTIWVHGGTYQGPFVCNLVGTSVAPIIIRNYDNERATIDVGLVWNDRGFNFVSSSYVWLWGMEISWTGTDRTTAFTGGSDEKTDTDIPFGFSTSGGTENGLKVINCIVHDVSQNEAWSNSVGMEISGNLIYNTGYIGAQGHHVYTQNAHGARKQFTENIMMNGVGSGYAFHAFSSSELLDSIRIAHNVFAENMITQRNGVLYGDQGSVRIDGAIIDSNYSWGVSVDLGYAAAGVNNPLARGNVLLSKGQLSGGWAAGLQVRLPSDGTISGNTFFYNGMIYDTIGLGRNYALFASTYPDNVNWGWDNALPPDSVRPTSGDSIFVILNNYEIGRAHVVVYNWDGVFDTATVSMAGIYSNGDTVNIRNAANYYGDIPLLVEVVGGNIKIPMDSVRWTVAQPIAGSNISNLLPSFGVFIATAGSITDLGEPPVINTDPVSATVNRDATNVFTVTASNAITSYQWQKNSVNISGATSSSYTATATWPTNHGAQYRCIVTNAAGSDTSAAATLSIMLSNNWFSK